LLLGHTTLPFDLCRKTGSIVTDRIIVTGNDVSSRKLVRIVQALNGGGFCTISRMGTAQAPWSEPNDGLDARLQNARENGVSWRDVEGGKAISLMIDLQGCLISDVQTRSILKLLNTTSLSYYSSQFPIILILTGRTGTKCATIPLCRLPEFRRISKSPGENTDMVGTMEREKVASTNEAEKHSEGQIAKSIEEYTARLPSDLFLWAAGGSIIGSLSLMAMGKRHEALFVGQWAPTFLLLGIYNKIVKVSGHDRTQRA
jgi:hypothetical protein